MTSMYERAGTSRERGEDGSEGETVAYRMMSGCVFSVYVCVY